MPVRDPILIAFGRKVTASAFLLAVHESATLLHQKDYLSMVTQKFRAGWNRLYRSIKRRTLVLFEIVLKSFLRKEFFQAFAHDHSLLIIKSDQSGVERAIVETREAQSIFWI